MFVTLSFIMLSIIRKSKELIEKSVDWDKRNPSSQISVSDNRMDNMDDEHMRLFVYDVLRVIKDPERDATLEELNVIQESDIKITNLNGSSELKMVTVAFTPTIPHCSLATLIGLCIRVKLDRILPHNYKIFILIKPGSHNTEQTINKQINDKERAAAAMENPSLSQTVEMCIKED